MAVKVTGQFIPAGDFSIIDGKDVSGNITGSNFSGSLTSTGSFGRVEATSLSGDGSGLSNVFEGTTPSSSISTRLTNLSSDSSSFSTRVTNLKTDSGSFSTRVTNLKSDSGSFSTRVTDLKSDSGSFSTRVTDLKSDSGSFSTRVTNLKSDSGSFSTRVTKNEGTGSKILAGQLEFLNITASNNTRIDGNLTVAGNYTVSGDTTFVSSSTLIIGDNIIEVNAVNPVRYGGIYVKDVDNAQTGSLIWDSTNDYWVAGQSGSEFRIPLQDSTSNLTDNRIVIAQSNGRIESGNITDDGTSVTIPLPITASSHISSSGNIFGTNLVADSASVSTRLTTEEDNIDALQTDSGSFSTRVTNLKSDSGSFSTRVTNLKADSGSFSTRVTNLKTDSASFSSRITTAETELELTLISGSAQIATQISGAFDSVSSSLSSRLQTAEAELENTLISGSAQLASQISGAFTDGFEFDGTISGSATSTGSFGSVMQNGKHFPQTNAPGENIAFGTDAGSAFVGGNVNKINIAIGLSAGSAMADYGGNVFIGKNAAKLRTRGDDNVVIGTSAGGTDGDDFGDKNVFIGLSTGRDINSTNSDQNVFIGNQAGLTSLQSISNVLIGDRAGNTLTNSSRNVAIGNFAGTGDGVTAETTENGVYIGQYARTSATDANNETVIGGSTTGKGSNTVTIGNASVTDIYLSQDQGATVHTGNVSGSATSTGSFGRLKVDSRAIIGEAYIGQWEAAPNYAIFANSELDQTAAGNYSILAQNNGKTLINAATSREISFRINNSEKAVIDSSGNFIIDGNISGSANSTGSFGKLEVGSQIRLIEGGDSFIKGGDLGIGTNTPVARLEIEDDGTSNSMLLKLTQDDTSVYGMVIGNDTYSTSDSVGGQHILNNEGNYIIRSLGPGAAARFGAGIAFNNYNYLEISGSTAEFTTTKISGSAASTGSFGNLFIGNNSDIQGQLFIQPQNNTNNATTAEELVIYGESSEAGIAIVANADANNYYTSYIKARYDGVEGFYIKGPSGDKFLSYGHSGTNTRIGVSDTAGTLHLRAQTISGSSVSTGSLGKLILAETTDTALAIGHDGTDSDQNTVDIRSNDSSTSLRLVSNNDANDYYDAIFRANYNDLNSVELEGPAGRVFLEYRHTGRKTLIGHSDGNTEVVSTILSGSAASTGSFGRLNIVDNVSATSFTGIFNGALSGSAQIATQISGAFAVASASFASDINNLQADSASFSTRVTNLKADSGSFSTRVTKNEGTGSKILNGELEFTNITGSGHISMSLSSTGSFGRVSATTIGGHSPLIVDSNTTFTNSITGSGHVSASLTSTASFGNITVKSISGHESLFINTKVTASSTVQFDGKVFFETGSIEGDLHIRTNQDLMRLGKSTTGVIVSGSSNVSRFATGSDGSIIDLGFTIVDEDGDTVLAGDGDGIHVDSNNYWYNNKFYRVGDARNDFLVYDTEKIKYSGEVIAQTGSINGELHIVSPTGSMFIGKFTGGIPSSGSDNISRFATGSDGSVIDLGFTTTDEDGNTVFLTTGDGIVVDSTNYWYTTGHFKIGDSDNFINWNTNNLNISGTFVGDGSGLTGIGAATVPAGTVSSSLQLATSISGSFTSVSASLAGRITDGGITLPTNTLTSSAQISTQISGAFTQPSSSISTRITTLEANPVFSSAGISGSFQILSQSLANRLTVGGLSLPTNTISSSAQLSSNISGSFTSLSQSFANRLTTGGLTLPTNTVSSSAQLAVSISGSFVQPSASFSTRVTSLEAGGGSVPTGTVSGSAQLASDISGSFIQDSASFSTRITNFSTGNVDLVSGSATSTGSFGHISTDTITSFRINGSPTFTGDSTGFGIGVNDPGFGLDVASSGRFTGTLTLGQASSTDGTIVLHNSTGAATFTIQNEDGNGVFQASSDSNRTLTFKNTGAGDKLSVLVEGDVSGSSTSTGSFGQINTAGNVGLGITNVGMTDPAGGSRTLHIHKDGSDSAAALRFTTGDTGTALQDGLVLEYWDGAVYLWNYENTPIGFATNNTQRMTIAAGGNIGIGEGNPDTKLEVAGAHVSGKGLVHIDSTDHAFIALDAAGASHNKGIYFQEAGVHQSILEHQGTENRLRIWDGSTTYVTIGDSTGDIHTIGDISANGNISGSATSTGSFGLLQGDGSELTGITATLPSGVISGSSAGLTILGDGKVGINNATPQLKLDVSNGASGIAAHFGGNVSTSNGVVGGISFGYYESNNANYRKAGIIQEQIGDSHARGDLHLIVNTQGGQLSATAADARLTIDGLTGDVLFPGANQKISGSLTSTGSFGNIQTPLEGRVISNFTELIKVTVVSDGGNHYAFEGATAPSIQVSEGKTYRFDISDATVGSHPFRLSTTQDGTHGGGSAYTTGVTLVGTQGQAGAYLEIKVDKNTANALYYYCTAHPGMGNDGRLLKNDLMNLAAIKVTGNQVDFTNLPTSNPNVAGRLWNDSGTVKISSG